MNRTDHPAASFVVVALMFALLVWFNWGRKWWRKRWLASLSPAAREDVLRQDSERAGLRAERAAEIMHGTQNPALVCPHCQERGLVRVKRVQRKVGISGGKATAAVLTGGVSILATGLSRKQAMTQAHCDNCSSSWAF